MRRMTDEDVAAHLLKLASTHDFPLPVVLAQFMRQAPWLDEGRIANIKRLVGLKGGAASKRAARKRQKALEEKIDRARQGRLFK